MTYFDDGQTWIKQGSASTLGAWLYWLRYWLLSCCSGFGLWRDRRHGSSAGAQTPAPFSGRTWRRMDVYFERRAVPPARNLGALYALLPQGLNRAQSLERLTRISGLGRVSLYQMKYWGSVLRRRARLVCYDHGWWHAPVRSWQQVPASARPP